MLDMDKWGIEKGVRPIVAVMDELGIETVMSCEGHKGQHDGLFPHCFWVEITPKSFKANRKKLERVVYRLNGHLRLVQMINGRWGYRYFIVGWSEATGGHYDKDKVVKAFKRTWAE